MFQNSNIQDLVNEITQPDVICTLEDEMPQVSEERHLYLISSLLEVVKLCVKNTMYTPYVHIKDAKGDFIFNNRLKIENSKLNLLAINNPGDCEIHWVKTKHALNAYYCVSIPDSEGYKAERYLNKINFSKGAFNERSDSSAAHIILKAITRIEKIDTAKARDTSVTIHDFEPNTSAWRIECHMKKWIDIDD